MTRNAPYWLLLSLVFLVACGSAAPAEEPPAPAPTQPAVIQPAPTATVASDAPAAAVVADADAAESVTAGYGRNENGTFFYGAADAPVTLTDYSDFL